MGMTTKLKNSGFDFEFYLHDTIRKYYPRKRGWEIKENMAMRNGWRSDFVVSRRRSTVVIEAKDRRL
jgi:hypothetical protein